MKQELEKIIKLHLPNSKCRITSLSPQGNNYMLEVYDDNFKNINLLDQHKLVNNAVKELINTKKIHAVTVKTFTSLAELN